MTEETVSDQVATRIRALRKARGWDTGELAERCDDDQITDNVIENIESGRRQGGKRRRAVTVDEVYALAHGLEVPPAALLPGIPLGAPTMGPMDLKQMQDLATSLQAFVSLQQWRAENGDDD